MQLATDRPTLVQNRNKKLASQELDTRVNVVPGETRREGGGSDPLAPRGASQLDKVRSENITQVS